MDHIQNRPMDGRSIVAKENVNSLPNDQASCFWCHRWCSCLGPPVCTRRRHYLNPEWNGGWSGSDFGGAVLDGHVGYELVRSTSRAVLLGCFPDAGDTEVGFSAKTGVSAAVAEPSGCLRRSVLRQVQGC